MAIQEAKTFVATCDGCGKRETFPEFDERGYKLSRPIGWQTFNVTEMNPKTEDFKHLKVDYCTRCSAKQIEKREQQRRAWWAAEMAHHWENVFD